MNLSIVDHAFTKKIPAAVAFEREPADHLERPPGTIREDGNLGVGRLGGKFTERFVVLHRRFDRGAA